MSQTKKRRRGIAILAGALIACAMLARLLSRMGYYGFQLGVLRTLIYIGLMSAWGISVRGRIVQIQARRYLTGIACLIVLWFVLRSLKYYVVTAPDAARYIWYLYYVPMLLIPLLALFVALSLGRPEYYRLPKWTYVLYIPAVLLLLLVLSNDLHQLVFSFPAGEAWTDRNNGYGAGYYLVFGWDALCALAALFAMGVKCRMPNSRKVFWRPAAALVLTIVYGVLYYTRLPWVQLIAGDITAAMSLLIVGIIECCIQCGLIQSNTHYVELFHASTIGALITDGDFSVACAAENTHTADRQTLREAAKAPVLLEGGIRISEAPIRAGHVFWEDDISPMLDVLKELDGTREELESYGSILQEENKQKARRKRLEEQERLYRAMQRKTEVQAAQVAVLAEEAQETEDTETIRFLLWKITVMGAYLKRRSNLIFLAGPDGRVSMEELRLCVGESVDSLRLRVRRCALLMEEKGSLPLEEAAELYDFFEAAAELSMDTLSGMTVSFAGDGGPVLTLMVQCGADLTALAESFPAAAAENEDGIWYCALPVRKEGSEA